MSCQIVFVPLLLLLSDSVILGISAKTIPLENCGQRTVPVQLVVSNGPQSWPGDWPWHVAVMTRMGQAFPNYACGGTIITSSCILTAAHCTWDRYWEHDTITFRLLKASDMLIQAGISNLVQRQDSLQQITVEKIIVQEDYQPNLYSNDIAILQLCGSFKFTDYVKPICLWRDATDEQLIVDKLGYAAGWYHDKLGELNSQLHHVAMSIVSRKQCLDSNHDFRFLYDWTYLFCAGSRNQSLHGVDASGGGLYIEHAGKWILRGIARIGKFESVRLRSIYDYIVFVDVAHFTTWINSKTTEVIIHSVENVSQENHLTTLNKVVLNTLNQSTYLSSVKISNNSRICDCSSEDFMYFVQQNHPKLIICEDGRNMDWLTVNELCEKNVSLIITICLFLACSGFLIGILSAVYHYYHIEIKVWLFTHNLFLWFVTEEELDKDKQYDAFISYSHQDAMFVELELVPRMEKQMNLKTCVHERDWIPGETIPEQIIRSVENSRRTVIVLSKYYLESTWAQMEFRMAHLQSLADKRIRLVIIVLDDLGDVESMDSELKAYLKMNTYVKCEDPWFWDKLRYAMPHPVTAAELKKRRKKRSELEMDVMLENAKEAEPESEIN